jgi:hypothetical protein
MAWGAHGSSPVMAGLVPAIHAPSAANARNSRASRPAVLRQPIAHAEYVDGRDNPGYDALQNRHHSLSSPIQQQELDIFLR